MNDLVLASHNAKKLKELQTLLAPLGYRLRPVSEFSPEVPEETAPSFIENALLKARHAARVSGLPAIADDSGLEVEALRGAPGVYSARYAGEPSDDAANNAKLLQALAGVPAARRGARFVSALALLRHADDPTPVIALGYWPGQILDATRGANGFGYDPLFLVPSLGKTSAELTPGLKNRISHRGRAMRALLKQLRERP
ncbi:RdgB/HAM1 family non-canonical purine NTP pyrophosphatase [Stagnimonas aquatica]|uniref:dITP/XTP pyrophosphatase n=1 Tax=Stagnimonas aquatica TaxID=2689987 RepID=A0A3N0VK08_9GAMM|nr:RdgB/HAM1 family non-canonical purine NTP pyrophosphatase [Stagnimonas aquatica]ROH93093.1 RdgB/HAM1 family non-canonical purine NTP pyrophosphatase [Stagnimonas aquatica]